MEDRSCLAGSISLYFSQVAGLLSRMPVETLEKVIDRLEQARWEKQTVFTCGNGGSAATAIHMASDLAKGAMVPGRPSLRALSLCENISLVTAWANDASYDEIFAQRLEPWVRPGDVLIAISGSGNSPNVLRAVSLANAAGATTIGFAGFGGGRLKEMVDICVTVPSDCMEQVEDVHLLLGHLVTTCLRAMPDRAGLVESCPALCTPVPAEQGVALGD